MPILDVKTGLHSVFLNRFINGRFYIVYEWGAGKKSKSAEKNESNGKENNKLLRILNLI